MSDEAKVRGTELYDFVESFFLARHGIQVRESGVLCDLIRAAMDRFSGSRWIPLSDRMPGFDESFLLSNGDICMAAYRGRITTPGYEPVGETWQEEYTGEHIDIVRFAPTHWMPLPEPPKP